MNKDIEEVFINNFVDKRMRDRMIYELSTDKHRRTAMVRFSGAAGILKPNCIVIEGRQLVYEDIMKEMKKFFDIKKDVYILSDDKSDGTIQKFESALTTIMKDYGTGIIICDEYTAFIKTEAEAGSGSPWKSIVRCKK